jgi:CheY-like chemotaxis protein
MTANAFGEDRSACLAAGMNDHLGKPAAPSDLFALLLDWLSRQPADRSDGPARPKAPPGPSPDGRMPEILPGIDMPALLTQFKNNTALLRRVLRLAANEHRDDATRLGECAACGDFESAFKIAHHLKGTAGEIKAASLWALAAEAEATWRRGVPIGQTELERLTAALGAILAAIDAYLAAASRD